MLHEENGVSGVERPLLATYFVGSWNITWLSLMDVVTSSAG